MYFCIPTINGEINGDPIIVDSIHDVNNLPGDEYIVYLISFSTCNIVELDSI